jgi:hypothetical protein
MVSREVVFGCLSKLSYICSGIRYRKKGTGVFPSSFIKHNDPRKSNRNDTKIITATADG